MAKQEYIDKNREWLRAKAAEDGVEPLDKGIYRKVLRSGKGPRPSRSSVVTVHYTGRTISGNFFEPFIFITSLVFSVSGKAVS